MGMKKAKPGLYANVAAKRDRMEAGSGERMARPGEHHLKLATPLTLPKAK